MSKEKKVSVGNLNLVESINEIASRIPTPEHALAKNLAQPFSSANSGSRKIMHGVHKEHTIGLIHPEVPIISTGYENNFGHYSSSFIQSDSDYIVVEIIPKFSKSPNHHYFLLVLDETSGELNIIERVSYKHITESYGFQYDNGYLDSCVIGSKIYKDTPIKKSTSFDECNNRMDGVNLITVYLSSDKSMEDGIIISESAAKKFDAPLFKKVPITINDNDILLNLYGDQMYKTFPNIGEHVKNGILCGIRRDKSDERLATQSYERLKDIMMSDDKITADGTVIDINIYCNNPDTIKNSYHNSQLWYYYAENITFCQKLVDAVEEYTKAGIRLRYDLQKMYYNAKAALAGKGYIKDKPFSGTILEIMVMEVRPLEDGDKLSNRYGGKGVVSTIVPDHLMPMIESTGERVDVQYNQSTCVNRENVGQLNETSLTHAGAGLIEYMMSGLVENDINESASLIFKYLNIFSPAHAAKFWERAVKAQDDSELADFISSICMDGGIYTSLRPVSDCVDLDILDKMYQEFPWLKQHNIQVPIFDSNNQVRYVRARRPIVCGKQYIYRLKQYAEEKFSVTSLSATNLRNENSRSKANKIYKGLFTKTPIRFGEMESGDMTHLGVEVVIINLMLHSTSPHARRLAEDVLRGDPFNINIQLDEYAKNRSAEILNTYLMTIGLELVFEKVYKNINKPMLQKPMIKIGPKSMERPMIQITDPNFDFEAWNNGKVLIKPMIAQPMIKIG